MCNSGLPQTRPGMGVSIGPTYGPSIGPSGGADESTQYLVEGAMLACVHGSGMSLLKIPKSHNYVSLDKKKANCKDSKAYDNIPCFGVCEKNTLNKQCDGFIDLVEQWENTAISTTKPETVDGEPAISLTSVLLCKKGGIIIPVTSGQGYDGKIDWEAFLKRSQNIIKWVAGNSILFNLYNKDPINMNTGNYIYEKEDLVMGGIMPLSFHLFYNAMDSKNKGILGEGWCHNYEIYLKNMIGDELIGIVMGDGREVPYKRKFRDDYIPVMGDFGILKRFDEGYVYNLEDNVYIFNQGGRLVKKEDSNGNEQIFTYNQDGLLGSVKSRNGCLLHYIYNSEGMLIKVEDHTKRKVSLKYQYGKLRWLTNSNGAIYTYEYNENGKLDSITMPNGRIGVKNEYDGANRVIRQTMPDGGVVDLRYDDKNNRTYMKEQNGNMVIYESDERMRNIRTIYEDGEEQYSYNDRNQKTRFTDKNGYTTSYTYDHNGNLTEILNALGHKTRYEYDDRNQMMCSTHPDGGTIKYCYDHSGKLTEIIDQLFHSIKFVYQESGLCRSIIYPDNTEIAFDYDSRGNNIKITDAVGHEIFYKYDDLNHVIETTDGNKNTTSYKYNHNGKIQEIKNADGLTKKLIYAANGKIEKEIDFDGSTRVFDYNDSYLLSGYTNKNGNKTNYEYDHMNNLIKQILPNGGVNQFTYDAYGKMIQYTNCLNIEDKVQSETENNIKKITDGMTGQKCYYDALNRCYLIEKSDGRKKEIEYNWRGQITRIKDEYGRESVIDYDLTGSKTKIQDMYGRIIKYEYDVMSRPICINYGGNNQIFYNYYPDGRLKNIKWMDKRELNFKYDGNGNTIQIYNQNNKKLDLEYDKMNGVLSIDDGHGYVKKYEYNNGGNIISSSDAGGHETKFNYSPSGKLTKIVDPIGSAVNYSYDELDKLISIHKNDSDPLLAFERNLLGQVVSVTDGLGYKEKYSYHEDGKLAHKTDKEGYETSYEYKLDGSLKSILYNDGKRVELEYNPLGHLSAVSDWLGKTKIETDSLGITKSVTDYQENKITYEFGKMGERQSIIYPDGLKVKYEYDEYLRLSKLTDGEHIVLYEYGSNGKLAGKKINNRFFVDLLYDSYDRLMSLIYRDEHHSLEEINYTYNNNGNKLTVHRRRCGTNLESGTITYYYDQIDRLIQVMQNGELIREYGYDGFGNRAYKKEHGELTQYTYNAANQLIYKKDNNLTEYSYDKRGNLYEIFENGQLKREYRYDASNRLAEVTDLINHTNTSYAYNGLGFQVESCLKDDISELNTSYVFDITKSCYNLVQQKRNDINQNFVWDNNILYSKNGNNRDYYFLDDLGTPIRYIRPNGTALEVYSHDEFGYTKNPPVLQPFDYTGYIHDKVSGTAHGFARNYCPETGRFVSEDNISFIFINNIKTLNTYHYCFNNPINFIDPLGYSPENLAFNFNAYFSLSSVYGYTISGLGGMNSIGIESLIKGCYSAPRPNNIGKGTWAKIVAQDVDDLTRFSTKASTALNNVAYIGAVIDVGMGIQENLESEASVGEIISDGVVDASLTGGTIWASTAAGAAIGSLVPGAGTLAGAIVGTAVGVIAGGVMYFVTDVVEVDGKNMRNTIKDDIASFFGFK